jgi:hypothetical protein
MTTTVNELRIDRCGDCGAEYVYRHREYRWTLVADGIILQQCRPCRLFASARAHEQAADRLRTQAHAAVGPRNRMVKRLKAKAATPPPTTRTP